MKRILVTVLLALALAGCARDANGNLVNPLASFANPIKPAALDQAEILYDGSLKLFVRYRDLCAQRAIGPSCRTYVRTAQGVIPRAEGARAAAENFVTNNPTLDATQIISVYSNAVADFTDATNKLAGVH